MKIGIYSRQAKPADLAFVQELWAVCTQLHIQTYVCADYFEQLQGLPATACHLPQQVQLFSRTAPLPPLDCLISIGGDGTLLDTLDIVRHSGIPILGINTGRLGLLTSISRNQISPALAALQSGKYHLEQRTLIALQTQPSLFGDNCFALNEFAIHKTDTAAMITVHTYINGRFVNSYWADGVVVATPSGSTAYSLSCGGPIVEPSAGVFVITPVAPHNLSSRPLVVPDNCHIRFEVSGRSDHFLCSLDARYQTFDDQTSLSLSKAHFTLNLVRFAEADFFSTIRQKLMWGHDTRN